MIKYKLIEEYPHSLPLGSISKLDYSAYPKNWEPFVEKEYEVVAVKTKDGTLLYFEGDVCVRRTDYLSAGSTLKLSDILSIKGENKIEIHSVKRLTDGKIFTVGENVGHVYNKHVFKILSFNFSEKGMAYTSCSNDLYTPSININLLLKLVEKDVLYTTFDGVNRYEYQKEHWVIDNTYAYELTTCKLHFEGLGSFEGCIQKKPKVYKLFSTDKAALAYVESLKPLFITEDGKDIFVGDTYWCVNTAPHLWTIWEQTSRSRTELAKTVRAFSSEVLAKKYIKMNKPEFSRTQVISALENLAATKKNIVINYIIVENEK